MKNKIEQVDVSFDGGLFVLAEFVRRDDVREHRVTEPDRVVRLMDKLYVFDKSVFTVGASICVCLHCKPDRFAQVMDEMILEGYDDIQ